MLNNKTYSKYIEDMKNKGYTIIFQEKIGDYPQTLCGNILSETITLSKTAFRMNRIDKPKWYKDWFRFFNKKWRDECEEYDRDALVQYIFWKNNFPLCNVCIEYRAYECLTDFERKNELDEPSIRTLWKYYELHYDEGESK